ncbi:MAG: orotidine-5'-phosphate decarboxylase [Helicobacteraceae bacterium]|nr:orotidine-5'-phosphate decarboxylase [Helicobacteraceae bacterium]
MKLCVALDLQSAKENIAVAERLSGLDLWFKVGLRSFIRDGWTFVGEVKKLSGAPIFLDLKLCDIPNTTADAALEIALRGADMFNIHASAGIKALETTMNRLSALKTRPIALAVTALTSFSADEFAAIYDKPIEKAAIDMARSAYEAGLDGAVCSVYESGAIKTACAARFLTLCPGVRLAGDDAGDQSRVASPQTALSEGVDFIVMGRPIIGAKDPLEAAKNVLALITRR